MTAGTRLPAGTRVGDFEVVEFLAQGGMSAVYVARHIDTGDRVALKVLAGPSGASAARFEREGRIAAHLRHSHIVAGRGHGRDGDLAWLAMELLRGEDLGARLERGGLPLTEVVSIAMQVCEALACAHAEGVVHRDLKPSNIFLCEAATPYAKVLDFGIARLANELQFTLTGAVVGTLAYMSPEQARGEREVDLRTDLWSLGVVLYECLAGHRPFEGGSALGCLYKIAEPGAVDLGRLRPDLPAALVDVVRRALRKARDGRPASALNLRDLLAACVPLVATLDHATPARVNPSSELTLSTGAAGTEAELRLVTAVVLRGARDPGFVQRLAGDFGGRVDALAGGATLCLFGADRWSGDEPRRAARFTAAVAATARGVGAATGRVLRSETHVTGAAVDAAALLAERDGAHLDAATVAFVRDEFALVALPDGSARLALHGGPASPPPAAPTVHLTALVGREAELGVLRESAEASAREQRVRVVTLLGGAGLGKSRLRHEAAMSIAAHEPSATVLAARCDPYRSATPFAALREALAGAVGPDAAAVLSAPAAGQDPQAEVDRVRASLETLLLGLSERGPLVLALDDAQWLDASSRATLRWLCDHASYLPLTVWLFARPEARDVLRELCSDAAVLELAALSRPQAAALLRQVAGAAPDALVERAGGHPLFLQELGRLYLEGGGASLDDASLPLSVEGTLLAQLDQLDPAEREFLKRAAVFGRHAWLDGVVALGGSADALPRLTRAQLVAPRARSRFEGAREFAFRSGTLLEVAYGLLPGEQRARLHAAAAAWLEARSGVAPEELARHWDLAGDHDRAAAGYADAAGSAARVADAATACAHAARALALTADPAVRWRALAAQDSALQLGGDLAQRRAGLAELAALADRLDLRHRVETLWRLCYSARTTADRPRARATGDAALALSRELGGPHWDAAIHVELAMLAAAEGRFDDARRHATVAGESAAALDDAWLQARATAARAYVTAEAGELASGLELFEAAAEAFRRGDDRRREAVARANAGFLMMELGRVEEAEREVAASIEAAQRVGNLATVAMSTHNLGVIRRLLGDHAGARILQARAADLGARHGLTKVTSEVATEAVYLALAAGAPPAEGLRCAEAAERASDGAAPALVGSARAASLRAKGRWGAVDAASVADVRARLAASQGRGRAELALALHDVVGDDAVAAIDAYVAGFASADDRAASRRVFLARFLGG